MHCVLGVPVRRVVGCKGLGFAGAGSLGDVYLVLWSRFTRCRNYKNAAIKLSLAIKSFWQCVLGR